MKNMMLSSGRIAYLSSQMALIVRSGLAPGPALNIIADEEKDSDFAEILQGISARIDEGLYLFEAVKESGRFPKLVGDMIRLGEETGYLEESFTMLANYYDRERRMKEYLRGALTYPAVLGGIMLCVILVLLIKVMPMFRSVYDQIGGQMSGLAEGILSVGVFLGTHIFGFAAAILIIALCIALVAMYDQKKGTSMIPAVRRIRRKMGASRFAAALSMGVSSGLGLEEALEMASEMDFDRDTRRGIDMVRDEIASGEAFTDALEKSGLFPQMYCRMLALGYKAGSIDSVLNDVSQQLDEALAGDIESVIAKVEPTLVIVLSLVTGLILLSVMLPMMNIMSSIG